MLLCPYAEIPEDGASVHLQEHALGFERVKLILLTVKGGIALSMRKNGAIASVQEPFKAGGDIAEGFIIGEIHKNEAGTVHSAAGAFMNPVHRAAHIVQLVAEGKAEIGILLFAIAPCNAEGFITLLFILPVIARMVMRGEDNMTGSVAVRSVDNRAHSFLAPCAVIDAEERMDMYIGIGHLNSPPISVSVGSKAPGSSKLSGVLTASEK